MLNMPPPTSVHLPVLADVGRAVVEAETQQLGRVGHLGVKGRFMSSLLLILPRNHLAFRHVRLFPEAVLAVLVLGGDCARVEGAVPGEGPAVPPRHVDNRYLEMKTRYVDICLSTHQLLILTISRTFARTTSTCSWLHTDPGVPWGIV